MAEPFVAKLLTVCALSVIKSKINASLSRNHTVGFNSLLNVPPIDLWWFCVWSSFCYALLNVRSSFTIILMRKSCVLFDMILYVLVNNLSVTSGTVLPGLNQY